MHDRLLFALSLAIGAVLAVVAVQVLIRVLS